MFDNSKAIRINAKQFDENAAKLNGKMKADRLFASLEKALTMTKYIIIDESMYSYEAQQVIVSFINRYALFIESFYTDCSVLNGKSYIELKHKMENKNYESYADLESSYTEDYYMNDCGGYESFKKSGGKDLDERLQDVFFLINPSAGEKILDVGCGRGELTYALSKSGADVIGIDYSEAAIGIAKKTYQNAGGGIYTAISF